MSRFALAKHLMNETKTQFEKIRFKDLVWTDIISPNREVLTSIQKKYKFHELDIEDCLTENQRSKIDEYDKYLFMVLHFPFFDSTKKLLVIQEIDIFIGQDFIITIHDGVLRPVMDVFGKCMLSIKQRKRFMSNGSGFLLYEIIDSMLDEGFRLVDYISNNTHVIEKSVFNVDATRKDMLKDILILKKDIITFRRVVSPQRTVIAQLEHKNKKFLPENLELYFDDLVDKVEKTWSNLESMKDLVMSIQETHESIISHTTNNVIKVLTIFSVIMLPLTVLTGFYGMNVSLPFEQHEAAYMIVIGGMIVIIGAMLGYFRWRKWL
ncbi:hypothetical protein A2344_01890 [Candidatus Peregrinibacteria bacterium RIFOXYB12_FULL_41_12]|nr:MAG: hypothetical protein A2244_03695 [Candidatus Peregrinibacteria bacterium RIFOXYA2_FULL_41_18]OGJ48779.1 MAG: hypothetical protein A2344_01890 [Candidatus Peregrinibacteria bacterium RIFOXYB12_FULL_41_12]